MTFCLLTQNILQTSVLTLHLFPNLICFQYLFISQKLSHSSTLLSSIIFFQLYKAIDRKGRASNRTCIKKTVMLYLFFSILMILWPFMKGNHFMFFSSFDSFNVCDYKVGRGETVNCLQWKLVREWNNSEFKDLFDDRTLISKKSNVGVRVQLGISI